jgi:3'-phosphoadenosine 5'-phosphosulfate sulfotransferase (PAPS reductase)/FAD synthetase
MTGHHLHLLTPLLRNRRVVLSVSGGKDSASASLYLHELGIDHDRVFSDTGWEHPLTYEYLRGPLAKAIGPIVEVRGARTMADLCRSKGMFPARILRFCTQELKVKPILAYLKGLGDCVNAIGIRAAESRARSHLSEWELNNEIGAEVWRPIIKWSVEDVIDIHRRHGLAPNPLYLRGAERVGCWPCIFARKAEIKLVATMSPERIDEIRALEAEIQESARQRYAARGETYETLGYTRPTFFSRSVAGPGRHTPIDDAVAWSRTARGGRQQELFDIDAEERGCMRWGMCDAGPVSR